MLDLTPCPAPDCGLDATIRERTVLESSDGPVEHLRTDCADGHFFVMPVDMLGPRPAEAEAYSIATGGATMTAERAIQDWIETIEMTGLERVGYPVVRQINAPGSAPAFRVNGHARRPA